MSQHYYPEPALPAQPLAIASLVTGIASYLGLPFLGALAAIITGHLAKKEIKAHPGQYSGEGLANTGLILGYLHLVMMLAGIVLVIIAISMLPAISDWFLGIINNLR